VRALIVEGPIGQEPVDRSMQRDLSRLHACYQTLVIFFASGVLVLLAHLKSSQVVLVDHPAFHLRPDDPLDFESPSLGLESLLENGRMDTGAGHAELGGGLGDREFFV
jgi:hypothetical protein